jgi:signal transduction histidine kinase
MDDEAPEEMDAILDTVSHDLRAPLRAMQGFAMALMEDCGDQLSGTGQEYLQRIIAASGRMDALLLDLLAYVRLGRAAISLRPVPLEGVLGEVLRAHSDEIARRSAEVTVVTPLPVVEAHPGTLILVIGHLLMNALRFTLPDQPPSVRIRAEEPPDHVRLWVEDDGIGIAPEDHRRIFRVFERLHGVEATHYAGCGNNAGSGIGLAIVREGVRRMAGQVGVESSLGRGSRFWIELRAGSDGDPCAFS